MKLHEEDNLSAGVKLDEAKAAHKDKVHFKNVITNLCKLFFIILWITAIFFFRIRCI